MDKEEWYGRKISLECETKETCYPSARVFDPGPRLNPDEQVDEKKRSKRSSLGASKTGLNGNDLNVSGASFLFYLSKLFFFSSPLLSLILFNLFLSSFPTSPLPSLPPPFSSSTLFPSEV